MIVKTKISIMIIFNNKPFFSLKQFLRTRKFINKKFILSGGIILFLKMAEASISLGVEYDNIITRTSNGMPIVY